MRMARSKRFSTRSTIASLNSISSVTSGKGSLPGARNRFRNRTGPGAGYTVEYHFSPRRLGYLVPASGKVTINGLALNAAAIRDESLIRITALEAAELVLVDVAA